MSRPRIAIPHWRAPTWERTKHYYDSLEAVGAERVIVSGDALPPDTQGLLLTGGADVNPSLYGERRRPLTDRPNRRRDANELVLLRQALERDLPVLAICRGHQLLNVALGGALLQNVEADGHRWTDGGDSSWHEVRLEDSGRLAGVYGPRAVLRVNSRHHQAVTPERLAPALRPVARSADGLVEGMEAEGHRWVVGVQWHPERPEMHPASDALFAAFVATCDG
ncbi:MAG TPA: gamma-glutamyl-gamma-aminobutyrate hydrolase family protein [Dehalococcoidia bacterium]|nr:gamma-glutamyl-gamma-aminobutyrate hydrolase family protein [Dehalococcoidia bacterium]